MSTETRTEVDPRIERTRRVVLEATAELIAESGFDKTTIEGISERSGVARSTIYRHWPGRTELLVDTVKERLVGPQDMDTGSLREDLLGFLRELVRWLETDDGATIAVHLLTVAYREPEVMKFHGEATRGRRDHLSEVIRRGAERGELPADFELADAANDLLGVFFYKKLIVHEDIDEEYVEARIDRWLKQVGWKPIAP